MYTTTAAHIYRSERHVRIDIGKCMLDVGIFELDIYLQHINTTEVIQELTKKLSRYNLTRKPIVSSPQRHRSHAPLRKIIIRFKKTLLGVATERLPVFKRVTYGITQSAFWQHTVYFYIEPCFKLGQCIF